MRVLVVDDSATQRCLLQRELERLGHECEVAADGVDALERLARSGADVVISDWIMPEMEGPELCRHLRDDRSPGYTYFIMLTSLANSEHLMEGMRAGADDYLVKPVRVTELEARLIAAARVVGLHRRLSGQQSELERLNADLREMSRRDHLTGLLNRMCLDEALTELVARYHRYGTVFSLAMCDVDQFKLYNDSFGHLAGDEVLCAVARTLSHCCREVDRVYRYGGEELLVAFPETRLEPAVAAAERMRIEVERLAIPQATGFVTVSAGVTVVQPGDETDAHAAVRRADTALYEAKQSGRNRVAAFWPAQVAA